MTEEIIKECAFYKDGVCASPINKTCEYCKNIDVSKCYHKQLKRLEKEVKHWQMECREAKAKGEWTYDLVRKKVDRLEQENKELIEDNLNFSKENKENIHYLACMTEQRNKLKSALEEIREIVTGNYEVLEPQTKKDIENKINEVLK